MAAFLKSTFTEPTQIIGAEVAVVAYSARTGVLFADTIYADAVTAALPVTGMTTGAPDVLAPVVKGEVVSALVVVIAGILDTNATMRGRVSFVHAQAVFNEFVNTIEVAVDDVADYVLTILDRATAFTAALVASAFVLVVAVRAGQAFRLRFFRLLFTAPN